MNKEYNIRHANENEDNILTEVALRAKAYWGYDKEFLEKCRQELTITKEFINNNPIYVVEDENNILGFYGLNIEDSNEIYLEYIFLEPNVIGKGIGKMLWRHMDGVCHQLKIKEIKIVAEPLAEKFYLKMGAKSIDRIESSVSKGRMLPLMIYNI